MKALQIEYIFWALTDILRLNRDLLGSIFDHVKHFCINCLNKISHEEIDLRRSSKLSSLRLYISRTCFLPYSSPNKHKPLNAEAWKIVSFNLKINSGNHESKLEDTFLKVISSLQESKRTINYLSAHISSRLIKLRYKI